MLMPPPPAGPGGADKAIGGGRHGASAADVQHADQGEQPAGGGKVGLDFADEPFEEEFGGLVVNAPARHVDRLDLGGGGAADRLVIAVADREIIADRTAKAAETQDDRLER